MFEPTGSRRDAASVIFNLPGYRVIDAVDLPLGSRRVKVEPVDLADGCPGCGVVSGRVHAWVVQRVRDVPYAGQVEVLVRKPRLVCAEPRNNPCWRASQIPDMGPNRVPFRKWRNYMSERRKSFSSEFKDEAVKTVIEGSRAVADVARELGIGAETLRTWVNRYRVEHADEEPPLPISERARLRELEKENRELKMKAEFLGKAAAFFAQEYR